MPKRARRKTADGGAKRRRGHGNRSRNSLSETVPASPSPCPSPLPRSDAVPVGDAKGGRRADTVAAGDMKGAPRAPLSVASSGTVETKTALVGGAGDMKAIADKRSWVYLLEAADGQRTYVGFTVNPVRRLRQHNGELVGGARYTSRNDGGWRFAAIMTADGAWWTRQMALRLEWAFKHCRAPQWRRSRGSTAFRYGGGAAALAATRALTFAGHAAVSRRLNDLYRLLNTRRRWTRASTEFSPDAGHSLRIYVAPPFCTADASSRLASAAFWSPAVRPLPVDLAALIASQ